MQDALCHTRLLIGRSDKGCMLAELGNGAGANRGELFTSLDKRIAPKFGHGLKPMPLRPSKEGCSSLSVGKPWSGKGILIPRSRKQESSSGSHLGPGQYEPPRMFDDATRRPHATMGLASDNALFTESFKGHGKVRPCRSFPEKVHKGTWRRAKRVQSSLATTPGPGSYDPCTTRFCECTRCGAASQGVSFGTRPETYTGQVNWPAVPGPGDYHVDCTTLGAATRTCQNG